MAFPGEDEQLCEAWGKIKHEISWGSGLGDARFPLLTFPSREGITHRHPEKRASLVAQLVKNLPAYAGDTRDAGLIPGLGRSPGGGHGNPFQCSCLENPWAEETGDYSQWGHKEWDTTENAPREERSGKNTPNLSLPFTHSFTFSFFQTVSGAHSFRSILLPRMPPRFLHTVSREGLLLFFFF